MQGKNRQVHRNLTERAAKGVDAQANDVWVGKRNEFDNQASITLSGVTVCAFIKHWMRCSVRAAYRGAKAPEKKSSSAESARTL